MIRTLLILLLLCGAGAAGWWGWQRFHPAPAEGATASAPAGGRGAGRRGGAGGPAVPVTAVPAARRDVTLTLDALGTVQPLNTVVVRSQVEGVLLEVLFREGQDVRRGEVLARIDDRTFAAALAQAEGKRAFDQAQLANARVDLNRYVGLLRANGVSSQQVDTQRAQVAMYEAQLAQDQAAIDQARTQLSYTVIRAPLDGRVGLRQVDPGNLVRASDANGLVSVTQMRPIAVNFTIPQTELPRLLRAMRAGPVSVSTIPNTAGEPAERGTVLTVDNAVDAATGTVRVKATFSNEDGRLWPGAFSSLRLDIEAVPAATVVPLVAVQQGPNGAYAFVVGGDGKVEQRPIALGPVTRTEAVVRDGLAVGERVVTSGALRLSAGTAVAVVDAPGEAPAAAPDGTNAPGEAPTDAPRPRARPRQAAQAAP